jgi:hypothetical protein
MALTVEDGSGLSNADAYVSEADADTYHAAHSGSTDWSGADSSTKEQAIRLATQFLDAKFNDRWKGKRANSGQALAWPRSYVNDADDYEVASTSLPQTLVDACCEAALKVVEGDTLVDDVTDPGGIKETMVKVGPITDKTVFTGGSQIKAYRLIAMLLRHLVNDGNVMERG